MNTAIRDLFYIIALLLITAAAQSKSLYVTDELRVGLHETKELESPIVKVLETGAQLEMIRRESNLSYVKAPDGVRGWIDNSYLKDEITTIALLKSAENKSLELENQITQLKTTLNSLKTNKPPQDSGNFKALEDEHKKLLQQYQSEQNRVKELQAQLAKMKTQPGQDSNNSDDSPLLQQLEQQLAQLQLEKQRLETHLASVMDNEMGIKSVQPETLDADNNSAIEPRGLSRFFYYALTIIVGFSIGLFFMDYLSRRRHGGFRV